MASGGLGGRIWGLPVYLNRGHWATFDFSHDLEKCFLLWFFGIPNCTYQLTASEATEVGLIWPKTSAPTRSCSMASFSLLTVKMWLCIKDIQKYRQNGGFQIYLKIFILHALRDENHIKIQILWGGKNNKKDNQAPAGNRSCDRLCDSFSKWRKKCQEKCQFSIFKKCIRVSQSKRFLNDLSSAQPSSFIWIINWPTFPNIWP